MAITASVEPESGRIVYAGSDFPVPIRFRFFPKKAQTLFCKTDPDPIWMALSGFSQTHRVRKQAGVQEPSGLVSGRTQPARHQFPTFILGGVLPRTACIILCKTIPDPIWFWLTVRFWPNGSGPEASCHNVQHPSGPILANASDPIRIGCESEPAMLLG